MRFENYIYLWLLCIIPVMTLLMCLAEYRRKKALKRLADAHLVRFLLPDASARRRWLKFSLLQAVIALVIVMLARPQMGTKVSQEKRNGIETIIAVDISNSMLAEDVKPNRLQRSKMLIETLVDNFDKDKVGLIVFAGTAFVQLPITSDFISAKMFLQNISPAMIKSQGTDIAGAINLASVSFTKQQDIGKAIIVITDGEDHEGGAVEAAKAARQKGYKLFVLGIGNTSGAPIPVADDYLKDNTGNTVMTALNESMCREIAEAGGGKYIHVDNTSTAQSQLNDALAQLQKGELDAVVYSEYSEQFQFVGLLALLLIIIEALVCETRNPYIRLPRFFRKKGTAALLLLLCSMTATAQNDRHYVRSGNREIRKSDDAEGKNAEVDYRKALAKNSANSQALYNLGCAMMLQKKDSLAVDYFQKALNCEKSPVRRSMNYHNIGVIMQGHREYDKAIEAYKAALRLRPHDDESRYNMVLCQHQRKKNQQQNNNNQQDNQGNDDKNKDQNKKQQDKNQDKNNDQNKNQNKDNQQNKQDKQEQQQMSKENAEQLLNAAMQEEKATQQRMNAAKAKASDRHLQKNW